MIYPYHFLGSTKTYLSWYQPIVCLRNWPASILYIIMRHGAVTFFLLRSRKSTLRSTRTILLALLNKDLIILLPYYWRTWLLPFYWRTLLLPYYYSVTEQRVYFLYLIYLDRLHTTDLYERYGTAPILTILNGNTATNLFEYILAIEQRLDFTWLALWTSDFVWLDLCSWTATLFDNTMRYRTTSLSYYLNSLTLTDSLTNFLQFML